eukprot:SAG22_NODE_773_length_7297_cov_102.041539_3_plen_283_part_00
MYISVGRSARGPPSGGKVWAKGLPASLRLAPARPGCRRGPWLRSSSNLVLASGTKETTEQRSESALRRRAQATLGASRCRRRRPAARRARRAASCTRRRPTASSPRPRTRSRCSGSRRRLTCRPCSSPRAVSRPAGAPRPAGGPADPRSPPTLPTSRCHQSPPPPPRSPRPTSLRPACARPPRPGGALQLCWPAIILRARIKTLWTAATLRLISSNAGAKQAVQQLGYPHNRAMVVMVKREGATAFGEATVLSFKGSDHCLSFCFSAFPCGSTALTSDRCNQ